MSARLAVTTPASEFPDGRQGLPRWVDAALAALGLLVASPVMLITALAVRATSSGPVLFRQTRVGRAGRPFVLVKFRSMHPNHKRFEVTAQDDPLITPVGRVLRRTKLDELPTLWNVLRGDLSLVGPRPEVPSLVDRTDRLWNVVLRARPGLTDPVTLALRSEEALIAEARGRAENVERFYRLLQQWKLQGYAAYLQHRSAWTDLRVLTQTLLAIAGIRLVSPPTVDDVVAGGRYPS